MKNNRTCVLVQKYAGELPLHIKLKKDIIAGRKNNSMCKDFNIIQKRISDLLEDLPKSIQQELGVSFVERTLLFSAEDDLLSAGIQKLFDSICQYNFKNISIDSVVEEYRTFLSTERNVGTTCKYQQKKIELIIALFWLCCFDELRSKKKIFIFCRCPRYCRNIAFLSRFIKALSIFGNDWDSDNLETRRAVRKKGRELSYQEGRWQLQQIESKIPKNCLYLETLGSDSNPETGIEN